MCSVQRAATRQVRIGSFRAEPLVRRRGLVPRCSIVAELDAIVAQPGVQLVWLTDGTTPIERFVELAFGGRLGFGRPLLFDRAIGPAARFLVLRKHLASISDPPALQIESSVRESIVTGTDSALISTDRAVGMTVELNGFVRPSPHQHAQPAEGLGWVSPALPSVRSTAATRASAIEAVWMSSQGCSLDRSSGQSQCCPVAQT